MIKNHMTAFGLLLSMAIERYPNVGPADWEDSQNPESPDLMLGTTNDWWLRSKDDGGLYVQARDRDLNDRRAQQAHFLLRTVNRIEENFGVRIDLPWDASTIYRAYQAWLDREMEIKALVKKASDHATRMLPKLVEALEEIQKACPRYSDDEGVNAGLLRIMQVTNGVLAEANNPEVNK